MPSLPRRKSRKRTTIRGRKRTRRSRGGKSVPASAASSSYIEHDYGLFVPSPLNDEYLEELEKRAIKPGTYRQNHNDVYEVIADIQEGVEHLSVNIEEVYREISENGLPQNDLRYKKGYIRKALNVLNKLANSLTVLIEYRKAYSNPEFEEFARERAEAVQKDMRRIAPINNALRSGW
jgi:hypothetical protein